MRAEPPHTHQAGLVNKFQRGEFVQTVRNHSSCVLKAMWEIKSSSESQLQVRQLDLQHTTVLSKTSEWVWASALTMPQNNNLPQTPNTLTPSNTSQALQAEL